MQGKRFLLSRKGSGMARPLFRLSPRLALCAELVREGSALCDVGTDHAYLPIHLLKSGKISRAIAADINPGPLASAANNAEKYEVRGQLILRLSDGLREIGAEEADDIVIAGMGGELILRIAAETQWLRQGEKRLILQPMSSTEELRIGLRDLGFAVLEEQAAEDAGKVYSAFACAYQRTTPETDDLYPYMGKLRPGGEAVTAYAQKVLRELRNRLKGAKLGRGEQSPEELLHIIQSIEARYLL